MRKSTQSAKNRNKTNKFSHSKNRFFYQGHTIAGYSNASK
jgi:hypothetical protein